MTRRRQPLACHPTLLHRGYAKDERRRLARRRRRRHPLDTALRASCLLCQPYCELRTEQRGHHVRMRARQILLLVAQACALRSRVSP